MNSTIDLVGPGGVVIAVGSFFGLR